jgi:hypothetical protein
MDNLQLDPQQQSTFKIYFLSPSEGGEFPKGQITYTLTAKADDGYYRCGWLQKQFATTFIDEHGVEIDHSQLADVVPAAVPAQSTVIQFGGAGVCALSINVRNTLEVPVLVNIEQQLPAGTVVVGAGGATGQTNELVWELSLQPGEVRLCKSTLQLPLPMSQPPLVSAAVSVYDAANDAWLGFQPVPATDQVAEAPAPQLQAAGFLGGGFGVDLWTVVPGVFRVEASTDFKSWQTVTTTTNTAGVLRITDPAAGSHDAYRFYRARGD